MNTHYIKYCLLLPLLFFAFKSWSQSNFYGFNENALAINHKVTKSYKINFKMRHRSFLLANNNFNLEQQQIDVFHFSALNLTYHHKISMGVYYRNRNFFDTGSNELRFIQQFNYIKQRMGVRFGHRVRLEERFFKDLYVLRPRYRFAIDFPLNGERLDIKESYMISAIESLFNLKETKPTESDIRITAQIGWQISEELKLQTGLEHRLESYNREATNNLYFLTSTILKI